MGSLETKVDSLDRKVDNLETKVDNLSAGMRSHFNHIEGKLDQHQEIFQVVSNEMKSVHIDVEYLSSRFGKHDTEINNIQKKLQSIMQKCQIEEIDNFVTFGKSDQ